jgi:DNA-binding MarR family transcriptional regulator
MASKAALQQAAGYNITADRVLGALEAIVFGPVTARRIADSIGAHSRTVQRIVRTLERAQYAERLRGSGSAADTFHPTVRLLAMAAQLAPRLPLVQHGDDAVGRLEAATEFGAYLAVPSYNDVVIIACSGRRGIRPWSLLPALDDAAGRVLLAHRRDWRASVLRDVRDMPEADVSRTLERGHALVKPRGVQGARSPWPCRVPPTSQSRRSGCADRQSSSWLKHSRLPRYCIARRRDLNAAAAGSAAAKFVCARRGPTGLTG